MKMKLGVAALALAVISPAKQSSASMQLTPYCSGPNNVTLDDGITCVQRIEIAPTSITDGMRVAIWVDAALREVMAGDSSGGTYFQREAFGRFLAPEGSFFEASDQTLALRDMFNVEVTGGTIRFRSNSTGKYLALGLGTRRLVQEDRSAANDTFLTFSMENDLHLAPVPGADSILQDLGCVSPVDSQTTPPYILWEAGSSGNSCHIADFLKFYQVI